ncbi:NADPH-dependent pterin aldehyde reductase-like [Stylophora pistillata]|uniref:NADPH-dependent pterin aldehyde reductase-like n=1 Tax=Stylophora pistillata TaxID=50429 RepID=UPI000C04CE20|nr:NADPH-dependent pterin aldehyde reductase-like [Stylophora pistillata]
MASVGKKEVIVITGVSTGLGLAMVKWYISQGHTVLGCARSAQKINQLNDEFDEFGKGGEQNQFTVVDILNEADVKRWSQDVISSFGAPTFLLNNASVANNKACLWQISGEEFNGVIDVNVKGTTNVIRHFVPEMIKAGKGVVVNFSSIGGRSSSPNVAPYCASKFAIEGLSKAMALELPAPLTCVPLHPGVINTPMLQKLLGEQHAAMYKSPEAWAQDACPFILAIDHSQNGMSLTAP